MTDITEIASHVWLFNANGSPGNLTIRSADSLGNLVDVSAIFDGVARKDPWTGRWDDAAKRISLTRVLPNNITQDYIGFLGDNDPGNLILAGSFTESDIPATAARTNFGWFATNPQPIIL